MYFGLILLKMTPNDNFLTKKSSRPIERRSTTRTKYCVHLDMIQASTLIGNWFVRAIAYCTANRFKSENAGLYFIAFKRVRTGPRWRSTAGLSTAQKLPYVFD